MVLGEWQRSGYRRRVFFSSQTHCGTARQLEWKHRSSQLQSTGLFWGGRGAEDFLSKYRHSASLRRLGIIFIGAKRLKRVEPRKKTNSESNNLELRSVSYADAKNLEKQVWIEIFWGCWCYCLHEQDSVPKTDRWWRLGFQRPSRRKPVPSRDVQSAGPACIPIRSDWPKWPFRSEVKAAFGPRLSPCPESRAEPNRSSDAAAEPSSARQTWWPKSAPVMSGRSQSEADGEEDRAREGEKATHTYWLVHILALR